MASTQCRDLLSRSGNYDIFGLRKNFEALWTRTKTRAAIQSESCN
jgi:hypothetical protein